MSALLELRNVSVRFGEVAALTDASLVVQPGDRLGLVGESGSGKSTLGLAVLGLLPPKAQAMGEVLFKGKPLNWHDDRAMTALRGTGIGFVYQDPMSAYSPVHSIGTHLMTAIRTAYPRLGKREATERAVALLEEVEIPKARERLSHYPHEYSGGMRQRVMIAAALAADPKLLIADEPTTALDVTTQASVLRLFDRIVTARQMAFILVTHDLGVVAEACREVCVMYGGRILHRTTVERLRQDPLHPYTRALLDARPRMGARGARLATIAAAGEGVARTGCPFEPRCWKGRGRPLCQSQMPALLPHPSGDLVACHYPGGEDA